MKEVIRDNFHVVAEETNVPLDIFLMTLSFMIEDSSYFMYGCRVYRQCRGLTMRNELSQVKANA